MGNLISIWESIVQLAIQLFVIRIRIRIIGEAVSLLCLPMLTVVTMIGICVEQKRSARKRKGKRRNSDS